MKGLSTVVFLLATVLAVTAARLVDTSSAALHSRGEEAQAALSSPWFCHNLDCPRYEVVETTDDYEVREYESSAWVSMDVEAYAYTLATTKAFQQLYQYIDGANKEAVKIPMTAPVKTRISAAAGPFCKNNFTVSLMIPFGFQKRGVPKPNNPDLYVECLPAFTAYVAQKGGYVMDDWSVQKLVKSLANALERDGREYEEESFVIAGYDPPFRITGRHNEAWLVAKQEEAGAAQ